MDTNGVRRFIRKKIDEGLFTAASVTFGRSSGELFSVQEGQLAKKIDRSVSETTVFDLQSMTKALVTLPLFLALQKRNKLGLHTRVSEILGRSYPLDAKCAADAELRHLLTHSSGFSDDDMEGDFETAHELWQKIFTAPRHFPPGEGIEYSDANYRVLGKVIETVTGETLECLGKRHVYPELPGMAYLPLDPFDVAGCPDAHGTIDDEHVRLLGGIVGCDGLFASSRAIFKLVAELMKGHAAIGEPVGPVLERNVVSSTAKVESYYDSLRAGPKTLGWEVAPAEFSYAGKFHTPSTFEKSGGAGTFVWFDPEADFIFVYLTNHGKPKPFDEKKWNRLIEELAPHDLSSLIHDSLAQS